MLLEENQSASKRVKNKISFPTLFNMHILKIILHLN